MSAEWMNKVDIRGGRGENTFIPCVVPKAHSWKYFLNNQIPGTNLSLRICLGLNKGESTEKTLNQGYNKTGFHTRETMLKCLTLIL